MLSRSMIGHLNIAVAAVLLAIAVLPAGRAQGQEYAETPLQPAALDYTGTFGLRHIEPSLTGEGVTIAAVCRSMTYVAGWPQDDYLLNVGHNCLGEGDINFTDGLAVGGGISFHSTAIGGILVGNDPDGYHPKIGNFYYEGAAPQAKADVYEFWRFVSSHILEAKPFEADILTMSAGVVFEDWWTRGLEHLAEKNGLIVFAGVGNGSDVSDPVLYPAAGANVIGVGVVASLQSDLLGDTLERFTLPSAEHSSAGPTADQRCKPDIVAPGNCLVPSADSTTGYEVSGDWTSFATPVVAGTTALLVQKAESDPLLTAAVSPQGGNCVIKAILMNSAAKLPYWHKGKPGKDDDHEAVLDYLQGAGMLDALAAYDQLDAGRHAPGEVRLAGWDNNTIDKAPGREHVYILDVASPQGQLLTATLVWNRHFEDEYPFDAIAGADSDLTLEIWAVDPDDPQRDYLLDYSDSASDNVEHIHCPLDAQFNRYEIVAAFSDVSGDTVKYPSERYALVWKTGPDETAEDILWYDLDLDGDIDKDDAIAFMDKFVRSKDAGGGHTPGDINMDGKIDVDDFNILMTRLKQQDM
ncbi:MAG: S8 family serine peptidase [Planctomycetes bacterium]|nr:S8 family serine peptidase [Planctomycetota bacterium]